MSHGYMPGPNQENSEVSVSDGQAIAGAAIGILVLNLRYPYLPGNVANASTYNFPVLYKVLKNAGLPEIFNADPALLDMVIKGGKELEQQGARAIVGACGYFANYQKKAAIALNVPTFLSSLIQIPIIKQSLKPDQKIGVICANRDSLTPDTVSQCGVDDLSTITVIGAQDLPEFQNIIKCTGHFNSAKLERELVDLAKHFVNDSPDIGAILLECSDMPPYAWSIQNATKRPVFDFITMINWIYNAIVRRPFHGFM
jgi:hypothetical protein